MAFNVQKALQAGYSQDEINAYLKETGSAPLSSSSQPPVSKPASTSVGSVATGAIKKIGGTNPYPAVEGLMNTLTGAGSTLGKILLGTAQNVAKDVGTGMGVNSVPGYQQSQDDTLTIANKLVDRARIEKDPEQKAKFIKLAQQATDIVNKNAQTMKEMYTEDIEKPTWQRALGTGVEIANVANLPSTIKSFASAGKSLLHPGKTVGAIRNAQMPNVPTSEFEEEALKSLYNNKFYQFNANPLTQKAARSQLSRLLENINPLQTTGPQGYQTISKAPMTNLGEVYKAVKILEETGKAYLKNGDAPSTALGQGANLVSHAMRSYLKSQSPESARWLTATMKAMYQMGGGGKEITKFLLKSLGPIGIAGYGGYKIAQAR